MQISSVPHTTLLTAILILLAGRVGAAEKPNIIFIMADDLGQMDLGCYGQKNILTPHLDRMAAEGVRFTQCDAGATVCAPSRSVLMTGLHTGHTRVRGNSSRVGGVPPQGRVPLRDEDLTVAEALKKAGYATGITGKWGLGEPGTAGTPNKQGFDESLGSAGHRRHLDGARAHGEASAEPRGSLLRAPLRPLLAGGALRRVEGRATALGGDRSSSTISRTIPEKRATWPVRTPTWWPPSPPT